MLVAARLHLHGKDFEHQYTKKKLMFLSEKAKGAVNVHFKEHANMVTKRGYNGGYASDDNDSFTTTYVTRWPRG